MMSEKTALKIILALECAVGSGSIAMLRSDGEVICSSAPDTPARAEDILSAIFRTAQAAGVDLADLDAIAVSSGPGSFSGIRIGLATARGLGASLGIPCLGISLLRAMASGPAIAAVAVGKADVAWQEFESEGSELIGGPPVLEPIGQFQQSLQRYAGRSVIANSDLYHRISGTMPTAGDLIDAGENLAIYIAQAAKAGAAVAELSPIYLRNRSHASKF